MAAESAQLRKLIGKYAVEKQNGRDDPALAAEIAAESRAHRIKKLIDQAPPLPDDIRARLARLLVGDDIGAGAA